MYWAGLYTDNTSLSAWDEIDLFDTSSWSFWTWYLPPLTEILFLLPPHTQLSLREFVFWCSVACFIMILITCTFVCTQISRLCSTDKRRKQRRQQQRQGQNAERTVSFHGWKIFRIPACPFGRGWWLVDPVMCFCCVPSYVVQVFMIDLLFLSRIMRVSYIADHWLPVADIQHFL